MKRFAVKQVGTKMSFFCEEGRVKGKWYVSPFFRFLGLKLF